MAIIVTRSGKGSPLTNNEVDANFVNLNTELGTKVDASSLSSYQPLDGDLTAIAGLIGTSGVLRKDAANTWSLDTSTYLTAITSGQITAALGYTPAASGANSDITSMTGITGGISSPDFIQFDTAASVTPATGRLFFNTGEGGLAYTLLGGNVIQEVGQSQQVLVYNGTGATLTKGQVVYSNGAQGQRPTVALALATGDATSARTLGIVAETIANGAEGWVTTLGIIENIDTSAFTAGAQLYLSGTTAGGLTSTKPYAPIHMVYVARCIKSHATAGRLFVTVQNGYEMDELHNVAAQTPSNNDGLFYNTSTSLWENKSIVAALGYTPYNASNPAGYTNNTGTVTSVAISSGTTGLTTSGGPITSSGTITLAGTLNVANGGTGATSLTSGYLVKGNGASAASASVVYDNGINVGVGTASPLSKFHINGTAAAGAIMAFVTNTDATGFTSVSFGDGANTKGQIWVGNASYASFGGAGSMNYSANSGPHVWYTNYAERMRLSDGNLGLGVIPTTGGYGRGIQISGDPASDLGTFWIQPINTNDHRVSLTNNAKNSGVGTWAYNASSQSATMYEQVAGQHRWFTAGTGTAGSTITFTQAMTLDENSNLSLNKGGNSASITGLGTGQVNFVAYEATVAFGNSFSGPTIFTTGNTERMRIGSNGGIAIGGTGTDATLHIQSAVGGFNRLTQMAPSGTSKDAFNIMAAKNSGGTDLWWSWGVDTSNRWRINQGLGFANNGIIMDDVGQITSADVAAAFGYKGLPQNQRTGAYTLALSDIGKHLYVTAGAFAVTIPADATLNFPVGAAITFVCEDAAKTIVPASGVVLILAGTGAATTGTRTLAIGAVATLIKVQANRWYISGSGVT